MSASTFDPKAAAESVAACRKAMREAAANQNVAGMGWMLGAVSVHLIDYENMLRDMSAGPAAKTAEGEEKS